jgi:hypothetical protein
METRWKNRRIATADRSLVRDSAAASELPSDMADLLVPRTDAKAGSAIHG